LNSLNNLTLKQLIGNQLLALTAGPARRRPGQDATTPPLPCPAPASPARKGGGAPPRVFLIPVCATVFFKTPAGRLGQAGNWSAGNGVGGLA
jgi:hypothetical protein